MQFAFQSCWIPKLFDSFRVKSLQTRAKEIARALQSPLAVAL